MGMGYVVGEFLSVYLSIGKSTILLGVFFKSRFFIWILFDCFLD